MAAPPVKVPIRFLDMPLDVLKIFVILDLFADCAFVGDPLSCAFLVACALASAANLVACCWSSSCCCCCWSSCSMRACKHAKGTLLVAAAEEDAGAGAVELGCMAEELPSRVLSSVSGASSSAVLAVGGRSESDMHCWFRPTLAEYSHAL